MFNCCRKKQAITEPLLNIDEIYNGDDDVRIPPPPPPIMTKKDYKKDEKKVWKDFHNVKNTIISDKQTNGRISQHNYELFVENIDNDSHILFLKKQFDDSDISNNNLDKPIVNILDEPIVKL